MEESSTTGRLYNGKTRQREDSTTGRLDNGKNRVPRFSIALILLLLGVAACAAAERDDDAYYARIANAEDDDLKFDRPRETTGFVCGAYKVAVGDVDGDGILDLVVSYNHSDAVTVLRGDGNFGFTPTGVYHHPTDPVGNIANLALDDVNDDGHLDIVAGIHERQLLDFRDQSIPTEKLRPGWRGRVQIHKNLGNGKFEPVKRFQVPSAGKAARAVDIDNDGIRDLVYVARGVSYIRGDLSGGGRLIIRKGLGNFQFATFKMGFAGSSAYHVQIVDVNGDGFVDFFCPNERAATVTYFINPGKNIFDEGVKLVDRKIAIRADEHKHELDLPLRRFNANDARIADFTGDGKHDALIVWMDQACLQLQRGDGKGSFTHHSMIQAGRDAAFFGVGDFDRDEDNDFVVTHWQQEFVTVGLNDGRGHFILKQYKAGNGSYGVAVADFDRDGHLDFVTANYRGHSMNIYAGKGNGTFVGKGVLPGELRLRDGKWTLHSGQ